MLVVGLLAACSQDDEQAVVNQPQSMARCQFNLTVCLQPDIDLTYTRTPGDPGTYERFGFPRYFYIYAVGFSSDDGEFPESSGGRVFPLVEDDVMTNRLDVSDDPAAWRPYVMTIDPPQTLNDSVYGSTRRITIPVATGVEKMKLYVAASPTKLKHNGEELGVNTDGHDHVLGGSAAPYSTETDVLNLMFDVDDELRPLLKNLYASPYNYAPVETYGGEYYYTVNDPSVPVDITRIIYHVASKVDLIWNIEEPLQDDVQLSYVEARRLKKINCLLFRPTENSWTTADEANHFAALPIMEDDIAQQWYGRQYFYAIPFRKDDNEDGTLQSSEKYFDVDLHFLKNGEDKDTYSTSGYNLRLRKNVAATRFAVFVPWLRTDLRFATTAPFLYDSSTPVNNEKILE